MVKKPRKIKQIKKQYHLKTIIAILLVILIVSLVYYSGIIKPTCYSDDCFNKKYQDCSPAQYTKIRNNNIYNYKISRSIFSTCNIKIEMTKTAPGTDIDIKEAIEGKSMKCQIPKQYLTSTNINEFENLIDYCTGPLKEGMYNLMLKRMYGLVVSQMGPIINEMEKVLKEI